RATWTTRSRSPSSARHRSAASRCARSWTPRAADLTMTVSARPTARNAIAAAVAEAHRREWALGLAATARVTRDLDAAEECVQDAYVAALDAWARQGVPRNPGAWLTTAARHRALDTLRRDRTLRTKLPLLVVPDQASGADAQPADGSGVIPDD